MKAQAQRMIGALVLSLATAAVVVGAAQAEHIRTTEAGALGVGGIAASQTTPVSRTGSSGPLRGHSPATRSCPERPRRHAGVGAIESSSQPVVPDWFERAVLREATTAVRPDDRGGLHGPGMVPTDVPIIDADFR